MKIKKQPLTPQPSIAQAQSAIESHHQPKVPTYVGKAVHSTYQPKKSNPTQPKVFSLVGGFSWNFHLTLKLGWVRVDSFSTHLI